MIFKNLFVWCACLLTFAAFGVVVTGCGEDDTVALDADAWRQKYVDSMELVKRNDSLRAVDSLRNIFLRD